MDRRHPLLWVFADMVVSLLVFMVAYTLLALLTNILWCQPIEGAWDKSIKAKCYSTNLIIGFALSNSGKYAKSSLTTTKSMSSSIFPNQV